MFSPPHDHLKVVSLGQLLCAGKACGIHIPRTWEGLRSLLLPGSSSWVNSDVLLQHVLLMTFFHTLLWGTMGLEGWQEPGYSFPPLLRIHLFSLCPPPLHQLIPIDWEIIYIPFIPIWPERGKHLSLPIILALGQWG